eukprot:TRINITY_DN15069_c0_g1_i1.p1 TRINITY_DN15069_c0_g1~~TRINITY_DN15069_c0_g1_i1.p1  ORF type:complete len:486 (-),score=45.43 TRINITY_DN15069_c0_g1_i1:13-1470(-)
MRVEIVIEDGLIVPFLATIVVISAFYLFSRNFEWLNFSILISFWKTQSKLVQDQKDAYKNSSTFNANKKSRGDLDKSEIGGGIMSYPVGSVLPNFNNSLLDVASASCNGGSRCSSPVMFYGKGGSPKNQSKPLFLRNLDDPESIPSLTSSPRKVHLRWSISPHMILMIKKWNDPESTKILDVVASWLISEYESVKVVVEESTFKELPKFVPLEKSLLDRIDFIICIGGDGTLLHASSLFSKRIPPIIAFNMGSLGFLTPFEIPTFREDIKSLMNGDLFVTHRMRLSCKILTAKELEKDLGVNSDSEEEEEDSGTQVLNEVVIDRGSHPYLTNLRCYCDNHLVTTVQADGLIVASATGSTAYSLSSGGSLVHPLIPGILFTPICPHSLSFRPVLLPASTILRIQVPSDSRCSAWVSFDGRNRQELQPGDSVLIRCSRYTIPAVSRTNETAEWFMKLAEIFHWNVRAHQKPFPVSRNPEAEHFASKN